MKAGKYARARDRAEERDKPKLGVGNYKEMKGGGESTAAMLICFPTLMLL